MTLSVDTAEVPEAGRLPEPVACSPLSGDGFARIAQHWRSAHVWLSMWDPQGNLGEFDRGGPRFWLTLCERSKPFVARLARIVTLAVQEHAKTGKQDVQAFDLGPWQPDLAVAPVIVRRGRRAIGVVLAAFCLTDRLDEAFQRFCHDCRVDPQVMKSLADEVRAVPPESIERTGRLLQLTIDQAREIDEGRDEMESLAQNLDSTYEELNLIYRISVQMGLPQHPIKMLEGVGREILPVTRAVAIAFVMPEFEAPSAPAVAPGADRPSRDSERIIQIGTAAPGLGDLDRLAKDLDGIANAGYLLLNDVKADGRLSWAVPWLDHLVALPMKFSNQPGGVMFAINCDDGGEFTSVDVQLFRAIVDRVAAFLENQRLYDDLADLLMGLLHALVNSIDAKDPYTCGHSERVAHFSRLLAKKAGYSDMDCQRFYLAGLLHDVGKIGIPDAVLCKPGKLTKEEFDELRLHPEIGVRILSKIRQIQDLMPGVLYHHERMDGRGYPKGLKGDDIPRIGRIICLADCFDAMTTSRTYRAALPLQLAISEIRRCSGTQFDPELAELMLQLDLKKAMKDAYELASAEPELGRLGALDSRTGHWPRPANGAGWNSIVTGKA
ncbi:MAG: HD domain-containing protein [Planctomycetota bacterium]|nr:HD domain-containing protein [Planctomycetota bacterium]